MGDWYGRRWLDDRDKEGPIGSHTGIFGGYKHMDEGYRKRHSTFIYGSQFYFHHIRSSFAIIGFVVRWFCSSPTLATG